MSTTTITIRLPVKVKRRLDRLARATARSRSWLAASAVAGYVDSQEWIREGLAAAMAGRVVPHEKVEEWLDSWGSGRELPPPECEPLGRMARSRTWLRFAAT